MELGEKVSIGEIVSEKHDEETCVFCQATEPPKEITNELVAKRDGDTDEETGDDAPTYEFKNSSDTLGNALGGRPKAKVVRLNNNVFNAVVAAHHLIPGNASLKKSKLFTSKRYLWKDGNTKGNIGYNINAKANGVWSPGNYGVRPWGTKGAEFEAKNEGLEAKDFAFAAMEAWGVVQFHDAHPKYSIFVRDCLNKVFKKLKASKEIWCHEAKKKETDPAKKAPLYVLVRRLDTISARMKRMLEKPTNWKRNIYTSRFVEQYMDEKIWVKNRKFSKK